MKSVTNSLFAWALSLVALNSLLVDAHNQCTIAFVIAELSYRGIEVSTYDYADHNETLLGNRSVIINFDVATDNQVRTKFQERFPDRFFDCVSLDELDEILAQQEVDILYYQKPGHNDGVVSRRCPNAVHAVFPGKLEPHGQVYAYISEWFVHQFPESGFTYVPYMVRVDDDPTDLRKELGIPRDAIVFGRHGGFDSFNVPCAIEAIKEIARERRDIYFLFLNTKEFCSEPNVIFLPKTTDMAYKARFINSCDAMIHARWRGETFGLACAEFSIKNKPVIAWSGSKERAHIEILDDKGIYYSNKHELKSIITHFKKSSQGDWDAYSTRFSPEVVMEQFDRVFIQPLLPYSPVKSKQATLQPIPLIDHGAVNNAVIKQMHDLFGVTQLYSQLPIKNNDGLTVIPYDRYLDVHQIIGWNSTLCNHYAHTYLELLDSSLYAMSPIGRSTMIDHITQQITNSQHTTCIIISGASAFEGSDLEHLFMTAYNNGYQLLICFDSLMIVPQGQVAYSPVISAMTTSWLAETPQFAASLNYLGLLSVEKVIARYLVEHPAELSYLSSLADQSYQSRYLNLWIGLAAYQQKDYEKAAFICKRIIQSGYNNWRLLWYLGSALYYSSDPSCEDYLLPILNMMPEFKGIIDIRTAISA